MIQQKRISRREFIKSAAGVAGGMLLASCGPKEGTTPAVAETVLRFQTWPDPGLGPMVESLAIFEGEHPGFKVEIEPPSDQWVEKTIAAAAAGTAPDIIDAFGDPLLQFAQRGIFMNLQPYIDSTLTKEQIDDWNPKQYNYYIMNGERFALGKSCMTMAYVVNKRIWEQFGVDLPTSDWDWETALENCAKITTFDSEDRLDTAGLDLRLDSGMFSATHVPTVWSFGGEAVDADMKVCLLDQPPALEALQFLQDTRWKLRVNPTPDDRDRFTTIGVGLIASDRVGMMYDGSWAISTVLQTCNFPIDFVEVPKSPTGERATLLTTDAYGANKAAKNPDAAWELEKYITADGRWSQMLLEKVFFQPAKKSLAPAWAETIRQQVPRAADADFEVFVRAYDYARTEIRFCDQAKAMEILTPVLDEVYEVNKLSATDAFKDVAPKVTEALAASCS
jgi:multiple sugar transport system substrate-binding protein